MMDKIRNMMMKYMGAIIATKRAFPAVEESVTNSAAKYMAIALTITESIMKRTRYETLGRVRLCPAYDKTK
jgi:hypothetical protein